MQKNIEIIHHGAVKGVTGSCHELRVGTHGIFIDCGLFQGNEAKFHGKDDPHIWFAVSHIKALVLTHVHIDHAGRIPYLLEAGFRGPIYCSKASAILLVPVLEDAIKIGITRKKSLVSQFLKQLQKQIISVDYGQWQKIDLGKSEDVFVKLKPAGHILGSAYVECRVKDKDGSKKIVFSGDLGAPYAPLLPAPQAPYSADVVVLESTYGNRLHDGRKNRMARLQNVVERALENSGVLLVPAFSIGRTQELLYELEEIIHKCSSSAGTALPWADLEVIVDSPLANNFTKLYKRLQQFWDKEALQKKARGRHPLSFEQLTTVDSHADHLYTVEYLKKTGRPCVVIAASGMCSGGRIVNYLKALLEIQATDVLFVGHQAVGTPGRAIQDRAKNKHHVRLDGKKYKVNCGVHTISGYSAHADQKDLVNFIGRMRKGPQKIRLVHGEAGARRALGEKLLEISDVDIVENL